MSVNLLNHISPPVRISDELESFFHVLVYYAVRHLRSNCNSVSSWIDNYFHKYSGPEWMLTCGQKSYAVEVTGQLQIRSPDGPLLFHSPLYDVLAPILTSFHAHYKVMEHESAKSQPPPLHPETPPPSPPLADTLPVIIRDLDFDDVGDEQIAQWEAELDKGPPDDSPAPRDRELPKSVVDHRFMLDHLLRTLRDPRWTSDDRIPTHQRSAPETPTTKAGGGAPLDFHFSSLQRRFTFVSAFPVSIVADGGGKG